MAEGEAQRAAGAVLVAKGGKTLFARGYGFANIEHQVPNTTRTKFRLGSITKQFTAMAILILQERGKLKVEDPVGKYIDDAPRAWDGVTIHHLLTHTGGGLFACPGGIVEGELVGQRLFEASRSGM